MNFIELLQQLLAQSGDEDDTDGEEAEGQMEARREETDAPTIDFGHYTGTPAIGLAGATDTDTPDDQCGCSTYPDNAPPPNQTPGSHAGAIVPRRVGVMQVSVGHQMTPEQMMALRRMRG